MMPKYLSSNEIGDLNIGSAAGGAQLNHEKALEKVVDYIIDEACEHYGKDATQVPCPPPREWDRLTTTRKARLTLWMSLSILGFKSREDAFEAARATATKRLQPKS